jgi:hypothetical protein
VSHPFDPPFGLDADVAPEPEEAADRFDQCDGHNEFGGERCTKEADHGGPCSFVADVWPFLDDPPDPL